MTPVMLCLVLVVMMVSVDGSPVGVYNGYGGYGGYGIGYGYGYPAATSYSNRVDIYEKPYGKALVSPLSYSGYGYGNSLGDYDYGYDGYGYNKGYYPVLPYGKTYRRSYWGNYGNDYYDDGDYNNYW